ncbi:MAG: hypothetical protein ACOYMZ_02330 [Minisyncoccia bacterium]
MKKKTIILIVLGVLLIVAFVVIERSIRKSTIEQIVTEEKEAVAAAVVAFGDKMKDIALIAEQEVLSASIKKEYEDTVAPALITQWIQNPTRAPGRTTVSPWPERIEVISMEKVENYYKVVAELVEMTNAEDEKGTEFGRIPLYLTVAWVNEGWKVVEYQVSME